MSGIVLIDTFAVRFILGGPLPTLKRLGTVAGGNHRRSVRSRVCGRLPNRQLWVIETLYRSFTLAFPPPEPAARLGFSFRASGQKGTGGPGPSEAASASWGASAARYGLPREELSVRGEPVETNSMKSRARFVLRVSPCVSCQSVPYRWRSVRRTLASRGVGVSDETPQRRDPEPLIARLYPPSSAQCRRSNGSFATAVRTPRGEN